MDHQISPKSARRCKPIACAPLISVVCETNYGRIFDVRGPLEPNNLSYTSPGLPVHRHTPKILSAKSVSTFPNPQPLVTFSA